MATSLDYIPFDESLLIKPGHFMTLYEQDICNYVRLKRGLKIGLLNHLSWHLSNSSNTPELLDFIRHNSEEVMKSYRKKWGIT